MLLKEVVNLILQAVYKNIQPIPKILLGSDQRSISSL